MINLLEVTGFWHLWHQKSSEYLQEVAVWRHCYVNGASVRERKPNYFNSYIRPMGFDSWCWQRMLWNSILRLDGNWVSQRTHYVWCPTKLQRQTWSRVCLGNFTCAGTWTREGSRWSSAKQQWWKQLALADKWILMNSMQPPPTKTSHNLTVFWHPKDSRKNSIESKAQPSHLWWKLRLCLYQTDHVHSFFWLAEVVRLKESVYQNISTVMKLWMM